MSKVLLAAGLDLLREAERAEMDADKLYEHIIKSGDKNKNFHPVRENLRNAYQKWIKALETVNFVRRAAIEADRLKKLRKQLAKLGQEHNDDDQQQQDDENGNTNNAGGGVLLTDAASFKMQHNQRRGLAAVSDEMIRNGVPVEIITLCDQRMRLGFEHCEKIREKEASLLLSLRDADPHKDDCSRSRPGYHVAQVLAFRNSSPTSENQGLLQGNWTVTVPVIDGSYQILVKNLTDVLLAAPDVSCQVLAAWKPVDGSNQVEKREFKGPCPPGAAFLRSVGVVGSEGTIFVHVNSSGLRSSRIEVVVRRLVPMSTAKMSSPTTSSPFDATSMMMMRTNSTSAENGGNTLTTNNNNANGGGDLAHLLPAIVPLGGGVPTAVTSNVVHHNHHQPQDMMMMMNSVYQQNMVTDFNSQFQQNSGHQDHHQQQQQQQQLRQFEHMNGQHQQLSPYDQHQQQHQPQQAQAQQQPAPTAAQVKQRIDRLIASIEYEFPSEVVASVDDENESSSLKEEYEKAANKRTSEEKAFETFLMELPEPTDLFSDDTNNNNNNNNNNGSATGNSNQESSSENIANRRQREADQLIADLAGNMGPTLDELREMEEQMLGLEVDDDE